MEVPELSSDSHMVAEAHGTEASLTIADGTHLIEQPQSS